MRHNALLELRRAAAQRILELFKGSLDEGERLWLREAEVKALLRSVSKGYQATFFRKEGMWRSGRGYYRLFENEDGSKGLVFGFSYSDLELVTVPDPDSPDGTRSIFKVPKHVYLAKVWSAAELVKLTDITRAIDAYSDNLGKTTADEAVLYETDHIKGIYRSGGLSYVMKRNHTGSIYDGHRVREVAFRSSLIATGNLANPFGENPVERITQISDPGVGLFDLLAKRARLRALKRNGFHDRKKKISQGYFVPVHTVDEARAIIFQHSLTASLRYLRCQDPATDDDKKLDLNYYRIRRFLQGVAALFFQGKGRIQRLTVTKAPQLRGVTLNLFSGIKNLVYGGFILLAYNLVMVGLNFYGLVKPSAIDREALVDLSDPIVQDLSEDAGLIAPYQTLLRPIVPAAFGKAKILSKHTFDRVPPYGVKMEKSLAEWPSDLLESSLQERGRSIVQFMFRRDAKPSANPVKDVEAIKIIRTDGIVAVKFINENRVWGFYLGESFDPITPAPPTALLAQLKSGYAVEITNEADATRPVITHIPFEEAKRLFKERFNRSLMEGLVEKQCELSWRPREIFHNAERACAMTKTLMATTKSKEGTPSPEWRDAVKAMRRDIPIKSERRRLTAGIVHHRRKHRRGGPDSHVHA
jgi:hypothetical protein